MCGPPDAVRGIDRSIREERGFDSPEDGGCDDEFPGRSVRGGGYVRGTHGQSGFGALVSFAEESPTSDSWSASRGCTDRSRGADAGACVGCAPHASEPVYRGRPAAVSERSSAPIPARGNETTQDHEEGTIQEATANTHGRLGAEVSRIAGVLALSRIVVVFQWPDGDVVFG